jgi:hypothetical protein
MRLYQAHGTLTHKKHFTNYIPHVYYQISHNLKVDQQIPILEDLHAEKLTSYPTKR